MKEIRDKLAEEHIKNYSYDHCVVDDVQNRFHFISGFDAALAEIRKIEFPRDNLGANFVFNYAVPPPENGFSEFDKGFDSGYEKGANFIWNWMKGKLE